MSLVEITEEQFRRGEYDAPSCPKCGRRGVPSKIQRVQTFEDASPRIAITSWRCPACDGA